MGEEIRPCIGRGCCTDLNQTKVLVQRRQLRKVPKIISTNIFFNVSLNIYWINNYYFCWKSFQKRFSVALINNNNNLRVSVCLSALVGITRNWIKWDLIGFGLLLVWKLQCKYLPKTAHPISLSRTTVICIIITSWSSSRTVSFWWRCTAFILLHRNVWD